MSHTLNLLLLLLLCVGAQGQDWPAWRGAVGDNIAAADQALPTTWSESENVIWAVDVPGRGHSSPVIVGDRLFLTTADEQEGTQSVLCYSVEDGAMMWESAVFEGMLPEKIHKKNTHASQTVACDGERVFASFFCSDFGVHLVALDLDGAELWRVRTGDFKSEYTFGYGSSPLLVGEMIIVSVDMKGGFIAAFDTASGDELWRTDRRLPGSSYSAPILATVGGRSQIVLSGGEKVEAYDPSDGSVLWSVPGGMSATANTVAWNDDYIFASGGYPSKQTWAVDPARGEVVWRNNAKCYEQSLLVVDDHVYALADGGIAYCWRASDGEEMWRERLSSAAESASPLLAGGYIYTTNEDGTTFVFLPDPSELQIVATNQLGDEIFATPVAVRNRIFIRAAHGSGDDRREVLYCIGNSER